MSASVVVDQLVKRFGPTVAVDGASWSAESGRITALLGPNGSGKTTTVECLEGLQAPTSGTVRVLGTDPNNAGPEHRALVGVMLQDGGLPNTAGAERLLRHLASLYENPLDVDALMQRLGIDAFRGTAVRRLSGGQRQRLALASAIVGRPRVVFLDEPSAGLDPHARQDVWRLVRELRADGVTVVITTHSFEEAERLADHVVVMRAGQVAASGTIAQIAGDRGLEAAYFALTDVDRHPTDTEPVDGARTDRVSIGSADDRDPADGAPTGDRTRDAENVTHRDGDNDVDDSWRDQPTNCWPTPPPAAADDKPKGTQQ